MSLITQVAEQLTTYLEPIADQFRQLNIPEPITHWGHPAMMGIVIFVMGSYAAYAGWQGRLATDEAIATKNKSDHRKIVPWLFLFLAMGYSGGLLSLVIQEKDILQSPHFWTGTFVLFLLASNGLISATKFGGNNPSLRTAHAYLGSFALAVMFIHAALGLKLGLSI